MYIDYQRCGELTVVDDSGSLIEVHGRSLRLSGPIQSWVMPETIPGHTLQNGDKIQLVDRQERWSDERTTMWVLKEAR